jgi:serine/threonine protein phosphatase PrpC
MEELIHQLLDCGIAAQTLRGESESGDHCLVRPFAEGILVAVVDGLGHGVEAADAASIAIKTLKQNAGDSIDSLVRRCHHDLLHSRGVVMSIASFTANSHSNFDSEEATMTWLGIGNVGGLLVRAENPEREREFLLLRAGVVGNNLPDLRTSVVPVSPGDTLVLATDGIAEDFYQVGVNDSPQKVADQVLASHLKGTDDAMVLVARFLGRAS